MKEVFMKIYLVTVKHLDVYKVLGAFTTKEKADRYIGGYEYVDNAVCDNLPVAPKYSITEMNTDINVGNTEVARYPFNPQVKG